MRERLSDYQEMYGDLYNLEATPASPPLSSGKARQRAVRILLPQAEGEYPLLYQQLSLPVDYTEDIFEALDIQDELQTLYTSGTVFHAFLGEKLPDWKAAASW